MTSPALARDTILYLALGCVSVTNLSINVLSGVRLQEQASRPPKASNRRRGGAQVQVRRSGAPIARRAARFGAKAM
jgi:hypothetical protein